MKYKKVIRTSGAINYYINGKYVKTEDVDKLPISIINMEEGELTMPDPVVEVEAPKVMPKISIISGEPGVKQRFYNGQSYWLTEEEYNTYTLGKLAQVINSKIDGCEK